MIRHIVFDMGQVLVHFSAGLFSERLRLSEADAATLDAITRNNPEGLRIVNGKVTYTYRKIIPGMLLNDEIFREAAP